MFATAGRIRSSRKWRAIVGCDWMDQSGRGPITQSLRRPTHGTGIEQHAHVIASFVGRDDVQMAIAIDVGRGGGGRIPGHIRAVECARS